MDVSEDQVILVQVVARHGEKDGTDQLHGNQAVFTGLTKRGRKEMQALGHFLRQKYTCISGKAKEFTVKSSEVPRCVESAVMLVKGTYPEFEHFKEDELKERVETKPRISDHYKGVALQMLFPSPYYPESIGELVKARQNDHHFKEKYKETISRLTRMKVNNFVALIILRERTSKALKNGTAMPPGVSIEMAKEIECLIREIPMVYFNGDTFKLIKMSSLFQNLLENMKAAINEAEGRKRLHLYMTHDVQLIFFYLALMAYDEIWPAFGESCVVELYHLDSRYMVSIYRLIPDGEGGIGTRSRIYPKGDEKFRPLELFEKDFKTYFEYQLKDVNLAEAKDWPDLFYVW